MELGKGRVTDSIHMKECHEIGKGEVVVPSKSWLEIHPGSKKKRRLSDRTLSTHKNTHMERVSWCF